MARALLYRPGMHRPSLVIAAIAAMLVLSASAASADGVYVTESYGGTKVGDRLADHVESGLRVRLALGVRHGPIAVEGYVAGLISGAVESLGDDGPIGHDDGLVMGGLDLKYLHRISDHVEVYLRGSASRAALTRTRVDYSGRGLGIGAGIQVKGKVPALGLLFWPLFFVPHLPGPKLTGALFVDDGFEFYRLHPGGALDATPAIDGKLSHLTIGFALGSDF